jgi:hypothetical protein
MGSSSVLRPRALIRRIDRNCWLVLAFSLFAVLPLAGPDYFFNAHDAPNTVFFLTEFDAALRDGVWYPGWATDQALGYGYPTFVLYPPLAYYAAEVFHVLGAGQVAAIKWTWALATLGAGLAMYAYARRALGRQGGLLAAVVYVYVPYHLADIYVRADLAETCAFVWMPLALLAFHLLTDEATIRRVGLAGLAYGALWLTHNVTALVFTPVLAATVLLRLAARRPAGHIELGRAASALAGGALGLGIAAALILPNLFERAYIQQGQWVRAGYDYAQNFVQFAHLLSSTWGYAPGAPGVEGGMSFQVGAVPLLLAVVAAVGALRRPARERTLILFFGGATLLYLLLMTPAAAPLWELLPITALIQFPWRLLAITAVTLAVLSGLAWQQDRQPPVAGSQQPGDELREAPFSPQVLIVALVAVLASFPYTLPQYTPIPSSAGSPLLSIEFELKYTDMRGMTAWTKEMPPSSPLVEQYQTGAPLVTAEALAPGASVQMIRAGGASDELWVQSESGTALRFYTYYFPGWRVTIDGQRLPESALRPETVYGLLTVDVPAGKHDVLLRWGDTPLRLTGKGLTLACLILALALLAFSPTLRQRALEPTGASPDVQH